MVGVLRTSLRRFYWIRTRGVKVCLTTDRLARRFCIKYFMNVESFFNLAAFGQLKFTSSDLAGFEFFYL